LLLVTGCWLLVYGGASLDAFAAEALKSTSNQQLATSNSSSRWGASATNERQNVTRVLMPIVRGWLVR
jgi:hypothetical protein